MDDHEYWNRSLNNTSQDVPEPRDFSYPSACNPDMPAPKTQKPRKSGLGAKMVELGLV